MTELETSEVWPRRPSSLVDLHTGLAAVDGAGVAKLVEACRGRLPVPDKDDDDDDDDADGDAGDCPHRKLDKVERGAARGRFHVAST